MALRVNFGQAAEAGRFSPPEQAEPRLTEPDWGTQFVRGVQGGMKNLTDPGFLMPMVFAQGAFGLSRLALLRLTPPGLAPGLALARANLGAFAMEGLAFAGSARGLHHVMGHEAMPGISFGKELGHAYLTMGLLKAFGGATHAALHRRYHQIPTPLRSLADKIILNTAPQAAQFGGIYLSHTLAPGLGLGEYIAPAERAFQSAVSVAHFGAAGVLLNRIPGYSAANQKIQQQAKKLGDQLIQGWKNNPPLPMGSLAIAGVGVIGPGPIRGAVLKTNGIWMNASNNDGAGKDDPVDLTMYPKSDSEPPSGKTIIKAASRRKTSSIDLNTQDVIELGPTSDPLLGQTIDGRYQVESVLGEGGMGKVYLCRHKHLDKKVAIKVLRNDLQRREDISQRFINEAKAASMIGNPHIIDVSDFGRLPNGSTYFVMEYLEGKSLGDITFQNGPLPLPQLLNISLQMTEAMAAAHQVKIIHRDLKPDNIFISRRGSEKEFVKILDFGIAKIPMEKKLTVPGVVFGTPEYLSPEQAAGQKVDQRSDIYSMGVILYEMSTGRVPFNSENYMDIVNMHITQAPPSPRLIVPDLKALPPALETVILKCLRKNPAERYQTMEELNADLLLVQQGLAPRVLSIPIKRLDIQPWMKDWRIWAGVFGTVLAGGTTFQLLRKDKEEDPSIPPVLPQTPDHKDPAKSPATPTQIQELPAPVNPRVEVSVQPADARVFVGDKMLGAGRVTVEIPAGEQINVEVRKRGYKTEKLSLDGSRLEVSVKLKPFHSKESAAKFQTPQTSPTSKPSLSSTSKSSPTPPRRDEIIRPW